MTEEDLNPQTQVLAETANLIAWLAQEPDGETTYHLELNNITLHFFEEEWQELLTLLKNV